MRVLFVCMGNICRSPTAHYIFLKKLKEQKLEDKIEVDSAGTHDYHVGSRCDPRTYQHAFKRGYDIQHRARHFKKSDFENFDYILVADDNNLDRLLAMRPNEEEKKKIHKTTDFCMQLKVNEVPDPYYGGEAGFERVLDILEDACEGLLQKVKSKLNT